MTVETCVESVEPFMKFVPVTIREKGLPTVAQAGETAETVGTRLEGFSMMKIRVLERPLFPVPEAGLMVLTEAVPGVLNNDAGMFATTEVTLPLASSVTVVVHEVVDALELRGHVLPFH